MLQARRTGPQDSSSRLLSAASTSERASLASATAAAANTRRAAGQTLGLPYPRAARAQWFLGGAGRLVISRDQVREQLRYHHNDFLGRANAHHLAVRHSGPSPSKGPARRAPRFLLEFSRRPFTGPRLARPCARDKQGQRQTRARWSGAPAASLSVSHISTPAVNLSAVNLSNLQVAGRSRRTNLYSWAQRWDITVGWISPNVGPSASALAWAAPPPRPRRPRRRRRRRRRVRRTRAPRRSSSIASRPSPRGHRMPPPARRHSPRLGKPPRRQRRRCRQAHRARWTVPRARTALCSKSSPTRLRSSCS